MGKVLWHVTMSLDGYIAPPDDSAAWMFGFGAAGPSGVGTMHRTGAILSGRRRKAQCHDPGQVTDLRLEVVR